MQSRETSSAGKIISPLIGIPQILKERPKKAFKRSLKEMLLDILETEDSYVDVDTIIVKMKKVILLSFIFILFLKFHFNIVVAFK